MTFTELQSAVVNVLRQFAEDIGIDAAKAESNIALGQPGQTFALKAPACEVYVLPGNFLVNIQAPEGLQASVWIFCTVTPKPNQNEAIAGAAVMAEQVSSIITRLNDGFTYLTPVFDSPAVEFDELNSQRATCVIKFLHRYDFA